MQRRHMASIMVEAGHTTAENLIFFFFNDTATTEIYTLSLHDALPIYPQVDAGLLEAHRGARHVAAARARDRKSTRLNSSHGYISYAVFCLKKKKSEARISPLAVVRKLKQESSVDLWTKHAQDLKRYFW